MIITATEVMKRQKFMGRYPVCIDTLHKRLTFIGKNIKRVRRWEKLFSNPKKKSIEANKILAEVILGSLL